MAMVLARGDDQAGNILLILRERWAFIGLVEQGRTIDGESALLPVGPADESDPQAITAYWQRRRARDPDLWVIELDIPYAQRFAAETILGS